MLVVSGCPRSGTSLMMDLLRVALGEDRILGKKFPQEEQIENIKEQGENETDEQYAARMYVFGKTRDEEKIMADLAESKDMNPNGFWEMLYTVQGCHFRFFDAEQLEEMITEETPSVCKIVSQGLSGTDPRYVTKMIYMIRHPRAVAKSQERLKRDYPFSDDGKFVVNGEEVKIHTPEMYINVTAMASRYLKKYTDIPVLYVYFDDLIAKPQETLAKVQDFLGEGDFETAAAQIEPKLKRSEPEKIDSPFWEDAEFVYDHFINQDFDAIDEYLKEPSRMIHRKNARWMCVRLMDPKVEDECLNCMKSEIVRGNYKKTAENKNIDWKNEPCIFECARIVDAPHKTIEESIRTNHWLSQEELEERSMNYERAEKMKESFAQVAKSGFKPQRLPKDKGGRSFREMLEHESDGVVAELLDQSEEETNPNHHMGPSTASPIE